VSSEFAKICVSSKDFPDVRRTVSSAKYLGIVNREDERSLT